MLRTLVSLTLAVTFLSAAHAEVGTIDAVPAATLLLPYFEVDLDSDDGVTTLFSVNNALAVPAIVHVTLWTDLSVPTLDFNLYLTGYEDPTINLRNIFRSGTVSPPSQVASTQAANKDDGSVFPEPVGPFSLPNNPITGVGPGSSGCAEQLPLPPLPASLLAHIRAAHTGKASAVFGGRCAGINHVDNIARGYITFDNVSFCSLDFPGDAGYFIAGGLGTANNLNQLWGDVFYVDSANDSATGRPLVHLEASDELGAANYTFYRRYSGGADQREGLGAAFAVRYVDGGSFSGGTALDVWRDSKRTLSPFACGTLPQPFPLAQNQVVIFDEAENPDVPEIPPFSPPPPGDFLLPFPWESQRTAVGGPDLPVPFSFGWLYLNLNTPVIGSQVPFEPVTQNWVGVNLSSNGRFSVGYDGIQLDNVTRPEDVSDLLLPVCDGAPDPSACN